MSAPDPRDPGRYPGFRRASVLVLMRDVETVLRVAREQRFWQAQAMLDCGSPLGDAVEVHLIGTTEQVARLRRRLGVNEPGGPLTWSERDA